MSKASIPTLVVLGDSLSDNGNLYKLIGIPPAPYWQGRSSNGPTYAEQLASMLGMQLVDYAYSTPRPATLPRPFSLIPSRARPILSICQTR